jgi:hypothetical protein
MSITTLALVTAGFLLFSLVSGLVKGTIITAPLVFVGRIPKK